MPRVFLVCFFSPLCKFYLAQQIYYGCNIEASHAPSWRPRQCYYISELLPSGVYGLIPAEPPPADEKRRKRLSATRQLHPVYNIASAVDDAGSQCRPGVVFVMQMWKIAFECHELLGWRVRYLNETSKSHRHLREDKTLNGVCSRRGYGNK